MDLMRRGLIPLDQLSIGPCAVYWLGWRFHELISNPTRLFFAPES